MNPKVCLALATLSVLCHVSSGIFVIESAAAGAATGTALTVSGSGAALALAGGLVLLKGVAVAAALASRGGRGRRSAETASSDSDAAFAVIAAVEPAQCIRQLICDLASAQLPKSDNDIILSQFNKEVGVASPKFEYAAAAEFGRLAKDVKECEIRYACPVPAEYIHKLLA